MQNSRARWSCRPAPAWWMREGALFLAASTSPRRPQPTSTYLAFASRARINECPADRDEELQRNALIRHRHSRDVGMTYLQDAARLQGHDIRASRSAVDHGDFAKEISSPDTGHLVRGTLRISMQDRNAASEKYEHRHALLSLTQQGDVGIDSMKIPKSRNEAEGVLVETAKKREAFQILDPRVSVWRLRIGHGPLDIANSPQRKGNSNKEAVGSTLRS